MSGLMRGVRNTVNTIEDWADMSNLIHTHAHTHTRTKANARKGTVLMGCRDAPGINFKKNKTKKNE